MLPSANRGLRGLALLAFFVAQGGCRTTPETLCSERLPLYRAELSNAYASLEPWQKPTRSLASVDDGARAEMLVDHPALVDEDREAWRRWATKKMSEVQTYMDVTQNDRRYRRAHRELSEIGTQLVSFFGYADRGDAVKMRFTLGRIHATATRLIEMQCGLPE